MNVGPSAHLTWSELACINRLVQDGCPVAFNGVPPGQLIAPYPLDLRETRAVHVAAVFEGIRAGVSAKVGTDTPIRVGSCYRTVRYDQAIGGTSNRHPKGDAIDLWTPVGLTAADFHALILALAREELAAIGGVGRYAWGVHVDLRPRVNGRIARWAVS